jgi:hypothetical protein
MGSFSKVEAHIGGVRVAPISRRRQSGLSGPKRGQKRKWRIAALMFAKSKFGHFENSTNFRNLVQISVRLWMIWTSRTKTD